MQGKFINSWTNISEQTESTEEYRQFPANIPLTVDTNLQGDLYARKQLHQEMSHHRELTTNQRITYVYIILF